MNDDIVARLRKLDAELVEDEGVCADFSCVEEAADEIERLRSELRTYTGDGHNTKGEPCTQSTPS